MSIFNDMLTTQKQGYTLTENGAVAWKSSGKHLLDLNFKTASLRNMSPAEIYQEFWAAAQETPVEAMKWLFYLRDCRGGMGERRSFHAIFEGISKDDPETALKLMKLIPEYGYWKDIVEIAVHTSVKEVKKAAIKMMAAQIRTDCADMINGKSISLLSKYLPREHSNNAEKKYIVWKLTKELGLINKETGKADKAAYRKIVSELKHHLDLVETHITDKDYKGIDYTKVPSKANKNYSDLFKKYDTERYIKFIEDIKTGKVAPTAMKVGQLFPYEILKKLESQIKYVYSSWDNKIIGYRDAETVSIVDAMWRAYPRENLGSDTMVVLDRSGSMSTYVGGVSRAHEIADSLAILFSEGLQGVYKDSFITFSDEPQIFHLPSGSLSEKYKELVKYSEIRNTNIEAVFQLILDTAIANNYTQDQLPKTILILSDMEFDSATGANLYYNRTSVSDRTLFRQITNAYKRAGYDLPRIVFWNIAGRTNNVPMRENEQGVALISGFSPAILKSVLDGSTDPWENLVEQLNVPRYNAVTEALGLK